MLNVPFFGREFFSVEVIIIFPVVFTCVGLNVTSHDSNKAGWRSATAVEAAEISFPILILKLPVDIAGLGFKTPFN